MRIIRPGGPGRFQRAGYFRDGVTIKVPPIPKKPPLLPQKKPIMISGAIGAVSQEMGIGDDIVESVNHVIYMVDLFYLRK